MTPEQRMLRRAWVQLGLQTGGAVAVMVAVLTAVAIVVVVQTQHRQEDEQIESVISRTEEIDDPPRGMWLTVQRGQVRQTTPDTPAGLPDVSALRRTAGDRLPRTEDVSVDDVEYRVRTQTRGSEVVQVAMELSGAHQERAHIIRALLLSGVAGLVLAALVGAWLGRRTVTPISEALALQRRFVADASHELRTPLTLLSTRAQLIRRRYAQAPDNPHLQSDLDSLVKNSQRLAEILDDLLLSADPGVVRDWSEVNMHDVLQSEIASARVLAQQRDVEIRFLATTPPPVLAGSESALRRAINALLDNAVRHADRLVTVELSQARHKVLITVVNDGPGIDPRALPRIFDRFASGAQRDLDGRPRRYGLGLALVSEIAARHGGTVSALNDERAGAVLRIELPAGGNKTSP